ncbi:MAG: nucleoside deaminase [Microgenomates group bacterium]
MSNHIFSKKIIETLKELSVDSAKKKNLPTASILINNNDEVLAFSESLVASNTDATAHSERLVIEKYCKKIHSPIISNTKLITVIEPCLMCLSACYWAGIERVYYILPASLYWDKISWLVESKKINKQKIINQFEPPLQLFWLKKLMNEFRPVFENYIKNVILRK